MYPTKTFLHHATVVDDRNLVGILNGGQPVGDHDARPTLACVFQRFLDHLLIGIE